MPRNPAIKPQDIVPSHPDALGCLGDRDGWDAAASGNGWTNRELDITVRQTRPTSYEITHGGGKMRYATSATGALLIVDQLVAARVAE